VRTVAHTSSAGFSLLELLVVLALLVILTVMSTGRFSSSARRTELAHCQGNLQKIYLALSLYRNDNGVLPVLKDAPDPAAALSLLIPKSTTVTEIFICPGSRDQALPEGESFAHRRISYAYYMGRGSNDDPGEVLFSDWQVNNAPKRAGQQIFSFDGKKPGNNHHSDGGNLVSCGGAVSGSGPKAARDLLFPSSVRLLNPQ
jgi:prepilin-type N-terminal cleavage/methylation domain-containing protein